MKHDLVEIRWHARAGQGAVTAAKMLAECAITEGKFAQAMPEYGPERSGAPMKAYNRISQFPIRIHSQVVKPNILLFLDRTLLNEKSHFEDLSKDTLIIVNCPDHFLESTQYDELLSNFVFYIIDGDRISKECTGIVFPNLPMLGALAKVSNVTKIETLKEQVKKNMGDKVDNKKMDQYIQGVERGFQEVSRNVSKETVS